MALVWVATAPIQYAPHIRAFNRNDIVPDSVATALGLTNSGLVVRREVDIETGLPSRGVDPVTQDELDTLVAGSGRLSDASLRVAFGRRAPGRRLGALGDSITAGVIGQATPNANNVLQGSYLMYGCMQSAGRLEWGGQFGVPGNTTAQIYARVGQVIAAKPDTCIVLAGANDPDHLGIVNILPQIVDALMAAGIEPVLGTRPPSSTPYSGNTGVHRMLRAHNALITDYATKNGYQLVDFFADLVDPTTGLYKTGHNSDITHPNQTGYRVMGKTLADALGPQVAAGRSWLATDNLDETAFTQNRLFLNGTATPTNYYVAAAGTGTTTSLVTDPNFVGRAFFVEKTDASTHALQADVTSSSVTFLPGELVSVSFKMTTTGVEAAGAVVTVSVPNNSRTSGATNTVSWQVGADITAGVGYFESVVPPGTNGMSIQLRADGGNGSPFSYKIGQFSVRNLSRLIR